MTLFVLHRTINGWIVSDSQYLSRADVPNLRVFNRMSDLVQFLLAAANEKPPRKAKAPKKSK